MPHCEISFSADQTFDPQDVLRAVEAIILAADAGSGDTKGRAYPASIYHHSHVKVAVSLLPKAHRDAAFVAALKDALFAHLTSVVTKPCWVSVDVGFSGPGYRTEFVE